MKVAMRIKNKAVNYEASFDTNIFEINSLPLPWLSAATVARQQNMKLDHLTYSRALQ